MENDIPDYSKKEFLVLGCGNILFGDDGLGPAVVEYLKSNYSIPSNTEVINAGCSVRNILFDITLSDKKPEKIIIIDAFDIGGNLGEIFEIDIDDIPEKKIDDFSMHQIPTSNLLRELKDFLKIKIKIIGCQPEFIPEAVFTGLSEKVTCSIPKICDLVMEEIGE